MLRCSFETSGSPSACRHTQALCWEEQERLKASVTRKAPNSLVCSLWFGSDYIILERRKNYYIVSQ